MAQIEEIIEVTAVNSAQSISQKGFGTGLFVTDNVPGSFNDVLRIYSDTKAILDDGFLSTDNAYIAASAFFAQEPRPSQLIIAPITKKDDGKIDDWPTALSKISNVNDDWYGLATYTKKDDEIISIAKYIDTTAKIYAVATSDPASRDNPFKETGKDLGSILKKSAFKNTAWMHSEEASKFAECAKLGQCLAYKAGTATIAYKTLSGIKSDSLSRTQSENIFAKNGNTYQMIAGVNVTRYGTLCDGTPIDIKIGLDFIKARVQENIFFVLKNSKKVLFTESGIVTIQNCIHEVLENANEIVSEYKVEMPKPAKISKNIKAKRILDDIKIDLILTGAIHKVKAQINYQL